MSSARKLVLLLVVAAGLGGYNYHRNLQLEAARPRPFQGYSDAQLRALISGYEAEVQALSGRYERSRGERAREGAGELLDQRVDAFQQAAAQGARKRQIAGNLSEKEAALRDLKAELSSRGGSPWELHLHRLLTI